MTAKSSARDPNEPPMGSGHGAPAEGGEEQQSPITHVWTRYPNTETAKLKWVGTHYLWDSALGARTIPFGNQQEQVATSLGIGGGGAVTDQTTKNLLNNFYTNASDFQLAKLLQLRMTCPYNILKSSGTTSGLNSFLGASVPNWITKFDTVYQYYHVMECDWKITINFGVPLASAGTPATNFQEMGIYVFWRYMCQDDPPTQYHYNTAVLATQGTATENITVANNTFNLTSDDYLEMGGWHHQRIGFSTTHASSCHISGKYKFGQSKMDIKTITPSDAHNADTTAEGWAQTGSTVAFPENLSVIIVADQAVCGQKDGSNTKIPASVHYETNHLIQFKDLRSNYKFPTPACCSGNTTQATQEIYFKKGAAY
ncbi:Aste57867_3750 [Aphanomyces stellatus]|uniref:Aste57867_3750 protein n=1 Tax=Aphanomyces stellatus TaxID=120398 RepID=A0A485KG02_9STRA|nr:hypothetical protein As57867_003739 [Aphanomyces stellatus]VFT80902.1 Aste57867_3750 [Aphanomyces stellatus]